MFRKLLRDQQGAITILSALVLVAVIGFSALAVEFGHGLMRRAADQRVADIAAYSGALVYNSTGSDASTSAAVANIVSLNGLPGNTATAAIVTSPTGDGNQAVMVTVTTTDPLLLAHVLTSRKTLQVSATAYAEIRATVATCMVALSSGGSGVTLNGDTALSAPDCSVSSNATVTVPCGTTITTKAVFYNSSSPPSQPCNGIEPPSGTSSVNITKQAASDPLAGNSDITAVTSRLSTVSGITSPSAPSVPSGGAVSFGYSQSTTIAQVAADGCAATYTSSGSTWTVTCPNGGTYDFGAISLSGGITVNFNTSGSANTTYNFDGAIDSSGTALNFGPGTFNIAQGIVTGGGSTTSFGAGTFNIGASTAKCSGATGYSICNNGTSLVFGGPSTFVLSGGIYNSGGETLTLGSGSTNSFDVGAASNGYSLYVGGGSSTTLADATGTGDVFEMAGSIGSSGGSCVWLSAAAEHDINGYISLAGGLTLGAGVYTLADYIAIGNSKGGDVTCNGVSVGVSGTDVTFVLGGASVPTGNCAKTVFCIGAGFSDVTLSAPSSGSTEDLLVIGPTSASNTAGALFTAGANDTTLSGAFYLPNGPVTLSGAASVGNGPGQCLELIGSQITMSGGSTLATACAGLSSSSGSSSQSVVLVQ